MAHRRFGPPLPKRRPLGRSLQMLMVAAASAPVFFAFQNFSARPQNLQTVMAPKAEIETEASRKAWAVQAKDETRRALRLIAAQISELFPKGHITTSVLAKTFQTKEFIQNTSADQLVSGDPIPACQWLQQAFLIYHERSSPERHCKAKVVDLELEVNQHCRLQAMLEHCSDVPPLPYPSLFATWRICGLSSCENQISQDLATYLRFYKVTKDPTWILDRLVPMAGQALAQSEGPFVLQPLLDFAKMVLMDQDLGAVKTSDGISLKQKALEYVAAFDQIQTQQFNGVEQLSSDLYRPTLNNVARFHGLLLRAQIQFLLEDGSFRNSLKTVRQFSNVLKSEVFIRENWNLGYTPEVYSFIKASAAAGLGFNGQDVGQLKLTFEKHVQDSPWRSQPSALSMHLEILGQPKP